MEGAFKPSLLAVSAFDQPCFSRNKVSLLLKFGIISLLFV
ncbi:HTH-type transcriptional regulator AnsR [Listeria monocytogenes]|nr:HTH-type transcriptional regulator AnsR [Listeria monocytogenes]